MRARRILWMFLLSSPAAGAEILESDLLRLEVVTGTSYSYRLIDKASEQTILIQNRTQFFIEESTFSVAGAHTPLRTPNSLELTLVLAGTGRTATVLFTFTGSHVLRVDLSQVYAYAVREQFADQQEHYYGLFEYPFTTSALDNRGLDRDLVGYSSAPGTNYANARAPFYFTSLGYGIYVESMAYGHYAIAVGGNTSLKFDESHLTYHVMSGMPRQILQAYNGIAGGTYMPPDWAFGTVWWRDDHHSDRGPLPNAQARVIEDARRLQQLAIPASAMWIDRPYTTGAWGWGGLDAQHDRIVFDDQGIPGGDGFPDPAAMVADLNARGMQLMVWIANRHEHEMLSEVLARGYTFPGWESVSRPAIDLRDSAAFQWFAGRLGSLFDIGVRGYKIDRGHEGEMPIWAENHNVVRCHQAAAQTMGLEPDGLNKAFVFARNTCDLSRRYCAVWNGDTRTDWDGLQISVKNLLRCAAINFPLWTCDTGGYGGPAPSKELFARWLGFSCYTPVMEVLLGPGRTIWDDYDSELIDIARAHSRTHHDLLPYIQSHAYRARQTGVPIARPLVFDFPDDANVTDMWDEYLFGEALLVAPVVQPGATGRNVYLPPTPEKWLNYRTRLTIEDPGQTVLENVTLQEVPVFLRAGSILIRGDILQANQQGPEWAGSPWPGVRLAIEACVTRRPSQATLAYYTGLAAPTSPITLSRTAGRIDLGYERAALGHPLGVRFYLDLATAGEYDNHELSVYLNGRLANAAFRFDEDLLRLDAVLGRSPADFDDDGDVDSEDVALFVTCAGGPAMPIPPACALASGPDGAAAADLDKDRDVDQADFGILQSCIGGPELLAPIACAEP